MRVWLAAMMVCAASASGQAVAPVPAVVSADVDAFEAALVGRWAGVLEYRDYQSGSGKGGTGEGGSGKGGTGTGGTGEDTQNKRVKLPTWASINLTKAGYHVDYTYDDGPGKTVTEKLDVTLTAGAAAGSPASYVASKTDGADQVSFAVTGLATLKNGRGTLVLTGTITENGKPAEARTTVTIRRNVLEIVKETHAAGEPFRFRDGYTLTRLTPLYEPPAVH